MALVDASDDCLRRAHLQSMSGRNEFSMFIDDAQRQRVLRGLFENYYAAIRNACLLGEPRPGSPPLNSPPR
jgi:hypothetical protein